MDRWVRFSALPEGEMDGDALPLPITGLQSHGPSCPLLQPGDLQTPRSEGPANSCTMQGTTQGTTLLSPTR